jgi:pyridoxamine 5'-phosphate oxidase
VISDIRREYATRTLGEADTDPDPMTQFQVWFDEALRSQVFDANAMSLATASTTGEPSARIVLLKGVDEHGFVFFTQYDSAKGRDLAGNPRAALLFYWAELERQVRIVGAATRLPREASEAYFATRPVESQWAAWSARQSSEIATRDDLERQFAAVRHRFAEPPVPCPPDWGGFRVTPDRIEFWQGRPSRLHDRLLYTKQQDGSWTRVRLAP